MKKNLLFIIITAAILVGAYFYIVSSRGCSLPAPKNLEYTIFPPDSVELQWDLVAGANAYHLLLVNPSEQDTIADTTVFNLTFNIGGLPHGDTLLTTVRAICPSGERSNNESQRFIDPINNGVIVDLVVMNPNRGPCICSEDTTFTPTFDMGIPKVNTPALGDRNSYQFSISNSASIDHQFILSHENVEGDIVFSFLGCGLAPGSSLKVEEVDPKSVRIDLGLARIRIKSTHWPDDVDSRRIEIQDLGFGITDIDFFKCE